MRRRLDRELVERGMAPDLEAAEALIQERSITVDGAPALKSATLVSRDSAIVLRAVRRFASRGGDKLQGALEDLGLDVSGMRCLDAGAGSGGFTDCLVKAGAATVVAVDVGYGQFDWSLRNDSRVTLLERTNIRNLPAAYGPYDLVVGDLSFVSLRSLAGTLADLAGGRAACLLLVKPQFELAPDRVGPRGVVSDPAAWEESMTRAVEALEGRGLGTTALFPSRIKGAEGNQEFFLYARPDTATRPGVVRACLELVA